MERIEFNLSDYAPMPQMTLDDIKKQMYQMPFELMQKEAELAAEKDRNLEYMKLAPNAYISQLQNMVLPGAMSDDDMAEIRDFERNGFDKINGMASNWDAEKSPAELTSLVRDYSNFIADKITPKVEARNLHNKWRDAYDKEINTLSPELASYVVERNISKANSAGSVADVERAMDEDVVYGTPQWNTILSNDNLKSAIATSTISEYNGDILNAKEAGYIDDLVSVLGRENFSRAACNVINGILASNGEIRGWMAQWCDWNGTPDWIDNLGSCLSLDGAGNLRVNPNLPEEVKQQAIKAYEALTAYSTTAKKLATANPSRSKDNENGAGDETGRTEPVTTSKQVHMAISSSWGDLSRAFNDGDWASKKIIQQAGTQAIKRTGINFHYNESDVDQMLKMDFAELFGLYTEQTEEQIKNHVPKGYTIETMDDALYATYNGDFYFTTDGSNCYVNRVVKNEKGEETLEKIYKLHGNAQYYGFEIGKKYNLQADTFRMAHKDLACALYSTTQALKANTMDSVAVSYFDMLSMPSALKAGDKNALKAIVDTSSFSLIYSTENGYSETADKFPDGTTLSGMNIDNLVSVGIGTRLSEIVLECEDKNGNKFLCALKDSADKEKIYAQLQNILGKYYTDTTYQYMFGTPDAVRSLTYINRQPIENLSDGRRVQKVYLDRKAIIDSGFDNVPVSMEGCTIFKVFDTDNTFTYDIRTNSDYSKGTSILGDLHINNDYDLCSYMRTFNILFNEVPDKYDNAGSIKLAQRWLFGVSEDEKKAIKDEDVQKWSSAYGKRMEKKLNDIIKDGKETTRDRIVAAMLCGKIDTTDMEEVVNTDNKKEGMCYFTKDENGHWWQHILFRTDGGSGWAEAVIDYSSGSPEEAKKTFYIQPFDMQYVSRQVKNFYKTDFIN